MKTPAQDLGSLINAAQDEAIRKENRLLPERDSQPRSARSLLLVGVAAAGLAFAAVQLWPLARLHSVSQTVRDLDAIVDQARDVVEATRTAQGRLPDALPNAALAGLVAYAPVGNAYQLFAASGHVSVTLDSEGKKTVSKGNEP